MKTSNEYIRSLLLAQPNVIEIVVARIYSTMLPKGATLPAITFWSDGGGWLGDADAFPFQDQSIIIRCWAETEAAAYTLFGTLFDDLTGMPGHTISGEQIIARVQGGSEMTGEDNDTRARWVQCAFQIGFST